ncbi:MAG: recombinase family protein [Bacillota bacterium]
MKSDGEPLVAVLYYRVSTEEQGRKGFSLPEQRRECRARAQSLADARGAPLQIHEFEDTASGELLERPGLEACRDFLARHRADLFVCLDPDRFSRSLANQLLVTDEIERAGVRLVFVQHNYEQSPEGRLFFQMRGAISEFEKSKIVERTRRGRRGKLAAGGIPNYVPVYGYRWNRLSKRLEIDEERAPWVRQIFAWYAEGWSYQAIAGKLMALGVRAARRDHWSRTSIMRMVRNPTYAGRLVLNRWDCEGNGPLRSIPREQRSRRRTDRLKPPEEWVTIPVPAIIDEGLWRRAQGQQANRRRLMQRGVALLSGLCICGLCGGRVHYVGHAEQRYFRCKNRYPHLLDPPGRPARACPWRDIRSGPIEAQLWRRVVEWLRAPDLVRLEGMRRAEAADAAARAAGGGPAALERELAARKAEQRRVYQLFTRGLAPVEAEADLARLADQIAALEAEVASARAAARAAEKPAAWDEEALTRRLMASLASFRLEERQKVVRFLIERVILWPDGRFECVLK